MIELKTEYISATNEITNETHKGFMISMSRNGEWKHCSHALEDIDFDDYKSLSRLFEFSIKNLLAHHFNITPAELTTDEVMEEMDIDKQIHKLLKQVDEKLISMEKLIEDNVEDNVKVYN